MTSSMLSTGFCRDVNESMRVCGGGVSEYSRTEECTRVPGRGELPLKSRSRRNPEQRRASTLLAPPLDHGYPVGTRGRWGDNFTTDRQGENSACGSIRRGGPASRPSLSSRCHPRGDWLAPFFFSRPDRTVTWLCVTTYGPRRLYISLSFSAATERTSEAEARGIQSSPDKPILQSSTATAARKGNGLGTIDRGVRHHARCKPLPLGRLCGHEDARAAGVFSAAQCQYWGLADRDPFLRRPFERGYSIARSSTLCIQRHAASL